MRHLGQGTPELGDGVGLFHLRAVVADHPVGQLLQELDLRLLRQPQRVRYGDGALHVTPFQQHGERGVVEVLAAVRQEAVALAVQRAKQPAHQRVDGEAAEVGVGAHGVEERIGQFRVRVAASCQRRTKAAISCRAIGDRDSSVKRSPASQSSVRRTGGR